jgi:spore coat polysaccharide biosynthesis predicted glycosyltransferase SpsG
MGEIEIWVRARSGLALGIGHQVRAIILANALTQAGRTAGLILDEDAPAPPLPVPVHRLPAHSAPPQEAAAYPADPAPIVLDLSHPSMLSDLSELVRRLRRQGRNIALIDGLGREAYAPDDRSAAVDVAVTPYIVEPGAAARNADLWLHGPDYAVLEPIYADPPAIPAPEREARLFISISGTDPWRLTEAVIDALAAGGLPDGWRAEIVAGPGFGAARTQALTAKTKQNTRLSILTAPENLRAGFLRSRLALLGPGLAKYEAAACGVFSLICTPDPAYAQMNQPFAQAGLAQLLPPGPPDPLLLRDAILTADQGAQPDPRAVIDGAGAARLADRLVSQLFTESRDAGR